MPRSPRKPKAAAPASDAPAAASTEPGKAIAEPRGRPEHKPTDKERQQVKMLAAVNIPVSDIALFIGISEPTLRKHYTDAIRLGQVEANAKVAGSLYKAATDSQKPNITAMIFWLKARAGWREDGGVPLIPPPKPEKQAEPLGKKDAANIGAVTAAMGSDWEALLGTPGAPTVQ